MLGFFRKYQQIFYVLVTIVIVISFSFFGTYDTMSQKQVSDTVAFTTIDGSKVTGRELDEMVNFISTDLEDQQLFGGRWGPNFLNDGVVKKDFLESGLAGTMIEMYQEDLKSDLETRLKKERSYLPYVHPKAAFISAENVWEYLSPAHKTYLEKLKGQPSATAPEAIHARLQLFLAERKFPAPTLMQVLAYQQRQYHWVQNDPKLPYTDHSLFGYHTVSDWFGQKFIRLVAEVIINGAKLAEQKGYEVSEQEALADLKARAQETFEKNINNPSLGVPTATAYFNEQLRRLHLDQKKAGRLWRQVLLFRRLFNEGGNSTFIDKGTVSLFTDYAYLVITGDQYSLPDGLRLSSRRDLEKFQKYLQSIAEDFEPNSLLLPTLVKKRDEIPDELMQHRYVIEYQMINRHHLEGRVPLRDAFQWQVNEKNWDLLVEEFPLLGQMAASTEEERFSAIDAFDKKERQQVDRLAREKIVESHPEWIDLALNDIESKREELLLRVKGAKSPLPGFSTSAKLNEFLQSQNSETFSPDGDHFYRISVVEATDEPEILTFAEANQQGVLDTLLNETPIDVTGVIQAIEKDAGQGKLIDDVAASLRFYAHMREERERMQKGDTSDASPEIFSQWEVEQEAFEGDRTTPYLPFEKEAVFALVEGEWSEIFTPRNGNLTFFHMKENGKEPHPAKELEFVLLAHQALANEAKGQLLNHLLQKMQERNENSTL